MRKSRYRNSGIDGYYDSIGEDVGAGREGGSVFIDSLDGMNPEEFVSGKEEAENVRKAVRKRSIGNAVSTVFTVIFGLIFLGSLIKIITIVSDYKIGDDLYEVIAEDFAGALAEMDEKRASVLPSDDTAPAMQSFEEIRSNGAVIYTPTAKIKPMTSTRFTQMLVKLRELKDDNPDTVGYISIPGTKVSYPMVKGSDNEYYLHRSFTGLRLNAGSIFIDYRNSADLLENRNTVIYGHNMSNGSMFHSTLKFLEEDFFMNNDIIIYTFDGIYTYEVFSIFETVSSDNYFRIWFSGSQDFVDFCKEEEARSIYHKEGISFGYDSNIITLSTCVNGTNDGRYAIHAVLKKIEN
jgi:sortase B